ncbi:MAG TPA: hypothetical protein VHO72_06810 [Bacteroidales bacterium]|nr:hypothetical protein [Bacteroidales bacterium]
MTLSVIGQLAEKYLLEIPERYPYAILDECTVMPNHIHAIIIIDKTDDGRNNNETRMVDNDDGGGDCRDAINRVSTSVTTLESPNDREMVRGGVTGNKNPMLHHNISRIMNWYTGRVTFESRKIDPNY